MTARRASAWRHLPCGDDVRSCGPLGEVGRVFQLSRSRFDWWASDVVYGAATTREQARARVDAELENLGFMLERGKSSEI